MGYTRRPTIHTLNQFEEYPGLEVRVMAVRIGKMRQIIASLEDDSDSDDLSEDQIGEMVRIVSDNLVSWNLEDEEPDGTIVPVPCDEAGVNDLELDMLVAILNAWMEELTGPTEELGKDSSSAPSSAGPSLELPPMIDM